MGGGSLTAGTVVTIFSTCATTTVMGIHAHTGARMRRTIGSFANNYQSEPCNIMNNQLKLWSYASEMQTLFRNGLADATDCKDMNEK